MVERSHTLPGTEEVPRTHCIRCGICCMKGGPTLHEEDALLFTKHVLDKTQVYTLRKGEVVRNIDDTLMILEGEMIKIKGQGESWSCMFYDEDDNACRIYQDRPVECRALECWNLGGLKEVMARPCLQRMDLLNPGDCILKIMKAHEEKCDYATLDAAIKALKGPDSAKAADKILDLLQYDDYLRPFLIDKLGMDPNAMDFFFGRPMSSTIRMYGLCVKEEGHNLVLTQA
jgi:Fe-S-cluster containining protein